MRADKSHALAVRQVIAGEETPEAAKAAGTQRTVLESPAGSVVAFMDTRGVPGKGCEIVWLKAATRMRGRGLEARLVAHLLGLRPAGKTVSVLVPEDDFGALKLFAGMGFTTRLERDAFPGRELDGVRCTSPPGPTPADEEEEED